MIESPLLLFKKVFGILTPEEINELTNVSWGKERILLTDIVLASLENRTTQAKGEEERNSPVAQESPQKAAPKSWLCGKNVGYILDKYALTCQEAEKDIFSPGARKKRKPPRQQMSNFILVERDKLEDINRKSRRKEIFDLYSENSELNLERQKHSKDDLSKTDNTGILIKERA